MRKEIIIFQTQPYLGKLSFFQLPELGLDLQYRNKFWRYDIKNCPVHKLLVDKLKN